MGPKRMRVLCSLALVVMVMAGTAAAQSAPRVFTTIDAPGATATEASGVNNAGQIVGESSDAHTWHGFLRTAAGAVTIFDVPGAATTFAHGINDAGQIVGGFTDAARKFHAFVRTAGGTFTTISAPGETLTR